VSRSETEAYCEELGVKPRLDPSNADSRFLRNFVRLQLLPLLRKANTDFDTAIVRLASSAGEAYGLIHAHAEKAWPSIVETGQAFLRLDKHLMLGQPAAIRDELVRMAIIQLLGETRDFESKHISAISSMTASPAGIRIDLPHGLKASTEYASVRLSKVNLNKDTHPAITGVRKLKIPGTTSFQGWIVTSEKSDKPFPLPTDPFTGVFDFDFIEPPLSVSARRPGDRFQPLGMSEQMKLQDFMVNCHIPVESRDSVPLVRTSSGIVWVVGHRISHLARITPETRKFLRLRFEPK
jgi:tRNA(Ile)-lysidine synthase